MTKSMNAQSLLKKLPGVIAFPVTPFNADLSLDLPGLRKNIQHLLEHPIAAIVAAGGTGEMYSLTPSEHVGVVRAIVEEAGGRIPFPAGTGFIPRTAVNLARKSARAGADGILALPPYYPNADEEG